MRPSPNVSQPPKNAAAQAIEMTAEERHPLRDMAEHGERAKPCDADCLASAWSSPFRQRLKRHDADIARPASARDEGKEEDGCDHPPPSRDEIEHGDPFAAA
jgi:hypothetical protein